MSNRMFERPLVNVQMLSHVEMLSTKRSNAAWFSSYNFFYSFYVFKGNLIKLNIYFVFQI